VDKSLVEGISKAGRGRAEFVVNNTEIETKVMKLYNDAVIPSLSQLQIDWGCPLKQSPIVIPAINYGSRLVVYGLLEKGLVSEKIIISGINDQHEPLKWIIPVTERKGNTIHKIAAYSLIHDYYENENKNKSEIIQLSLKYQLATKFTSFVATAVNDIAATDTLKPTNIKLQKPAEPKKEKEMEKEEKDQDINIGHLKKKSISPVQKKPAKKDKAKMSKSPVDDKKNARSLTKMASPPAEESNSPVSSPKSKKSSFGFFSKSSSKPAAAAAPSSKKSLKVSDEITKEKKGTKSKRSLPPTQDKKKRKKKKMKNQNQNPSPEKEEPSEKIKTKK